MKKRIALVVNTLSGGGAEKTVANLSRGLSARYDVDIVVNDREHLDYPFRGHIISLEMPADRNRMDADYQAELLLRRTRVLRYLKKKKKYAAVISFSEMSNVANVLSGDRYGKTIISVRNSIRCSRDSTLWHKLITPCLMPWCYKNAGTIVSCSKGIADELRGNYGLTSDKCVVIYNGLELSMIREKASVSLSPQESAAWKGRKLIVAAGRLIRQKGHWHLMRAVRRLTDEGTPVHLLLLGEGELRDSLEKEAAGLGISDHVSMPGTADNPYKYMSRADVVVMPSLYEGFSNVLIEALACGVPVVSTDHETGAREILAPDTDFRVKVKDRIEEAAYGILVPVCEGDTGGSENGASAEEALMAEAIRRVLADTNLAAHYREAALQRAEQLDIRAVCDQWTDLLESGNGFSSGKDTGPDSLVRNEEET